MNPHRLTYGFASSLPFAMVVALATLAGLVFAKDRKPIPLLRETYLLASLWLMYTITTIFALYPVEAWEQWDKVSKVMLFTFITMKLFQDRERLRLLFLVIAFSIGFYGLKGGIWAVATGGTNMVYGPEASFLGSNNSIGLALNMILPFLFMLRRDEPRKWMRRLMQVMFWASIVAIIFTYSRGAVVGLAVVLTLLFLRGSKRLVAGVVGFALVALVFLTIGSSLIPDKWWERMGTIRTYDEDKSALGRLEAWGVAYRLALDRPLTGGGFWALPHDDVYLAYGASPGAMVLSAHSIYFSVLGDHGFVTLGIFVLLIVSCLVSLVQLRWRMGRVPEGSWIVRSAQMLEVSFAAYVVSGAFLTEAYFDLFYHLVSAVILLKTLAAQVEAAAPAVVPSEPARAMAVPPGKAARRSAVPREPDS